MAIVNFDDKEALYENPNIAEKNKITDANINLIKQVSQQTQKTIGVFTDNWTSASTYNVGDIAIYDNRVFQNLTGTNTATTPDQDTTNWVETTIAAMAAGAASGDTLPIGSIVPYGSSTAPANWLVCDGSAVSRTTYADLFAVIGTSYGSGDGSTTFNLPNLKGKVAVGQDTNDTDFDTIGETGGSKYLQQHSHTGAFSTNGGELTVYGGSGSTQIIDLQSGYSANGSVNARIKTADAGTGNSGNLQPYQVVCYIIKVGQSAGLVANVSNISSNSQVDTYSCNYINGIVERGANANGNFTKFVDGTLICRHYVGPLTTNSYSSATLNITFPSTFLNDEYSCCISFLDPQAYWGSVNVGCRSKTTTGFTMETWNSSEGQNPNQYYNYIAIGRWK